MSKILLNGNSVTMSEEHNTLLELVAAVEKEHIEDGWIITEVLVDGENISTFTLEDGSLVAYNSDAKLELTARDPSDVLLNSLEGFEKYLEKLIPGIKQISRLFSEGNIEAGNKLYIEAFEGIKVLVQLLQGIWQTGEISIKQLSMEGFSFDDKIADLRNTLEELVTLQAAGNYKDIAKTLEKKLVVELLSWQELIPKLRMMVKQAPTGIH